MMILNNPSSLDHPEYYCNDSNNKKNVYEVSKIEDKKSDCPPDQQDYRYDIEQVAHGCMI